MLILKELEIKRFMGVGQAALKFPEKGAIFFSGENRDSVHASSNGAGKSTLIDAISFSIFGRPVRSIKREFLQAKKPGYVRVVFSDNEKEIEITRYLHKSLAEIKVNGDKIKLDSDAVGSFINLDYQTFVNIHVLTKQDSFVFETRAARQKLFEKFVGLDVIIDVMKRTIAGKSKNYNQQLSELSGKMSAYTTELEELAVTLSETADIDRILNEDVEWGKLKIQIVQLQKQFSSLAQSLEALKNIRVTEFSDQRHQLFIVMEKLKRELTWVRQHYSENKGLLNTAKKGRCKTCGGKLPRESVKAECERLYSLISSNKKATIDKGAAIASTSAQQKELEKQADLVTQAFDDLKECASRVKLFLTQLEESINTEYSTVHDLAVRLKTRQNLMQENKDELDKLLQEAQAQHRKSLVLSDISDFAGEFSGGILRRTLLQNYLQNFNSDLRVTLKLFADFKKAEFTPDFEIMIDNRPFNSASTGEQMRFVLATYMNLFRYSATNKNRFNFIVFDDFDLGCDNVGKKAIADVLEMLGENMLILVLSPDDSFDRFDKRVLAIKEHGRISYQTEGL